MDEILVRIRKEPEFRDLPLPEYCSQGASGMDLYAAIHESILLQPGEWKLISTGVRISLPPGYEAQVRPRSGLALRHGIGILNAPGTIDSDYRGVVSVILMNFGNAPFSIHRGDRIAQLVITRVTRAQWVESPELDETERNSGGFGSTGSR